jgi:cytochrome P450
MTVEQSALGDPAAPPAGCPAHVPAEQFRHFDYVKDIEAARDPYEGYLQYRGEKPFWSDVDGGFWVLTDAAQIRDCFLDPETFSNRNIGLGYTAFPRTMIPDQLDPPEHTKYRKLLLPYFPPTAARALEPDIRAIARAEIATWADEGRVEFVDQFAGRFPQIVFLQHLLHFPVEEMETFLQWEHDMVRHPRDPQDAKRSMFALLDYLTGVVEQRAAHPLPDDMISGLLQSEIEGRPVTRDEVIDMAFLLFLAGLDTVSSALSMSFYYLAQQPALRDRLVNEPDVIPEAIEELLRYVSFVNTIRTANRDIDFHGAPMKAGDRILPSAVLAGRDPKEHDQPDVLDFDRRAKRSMAFGVGIHRCLGSHLARVELEVAFQELHRAMPDYRLEPSGELRFHGAGILGCDRLPLLFTPPA